MIASKAICDDTYSNKSWCSVSQGMFSLTETRIQPNGARDVQSFRMDAQREAEGVSRV
ncbi:hypothetical protein M407DRAFT_219202 [Tulasnella calospora MUT 4182]|uniref:Uncharacterized protein n=1 Tax=Tulasnella calospora MUT 4182 TaxID=1051891 RepID=A0A0C3LI03_9AGAM|nr:hypothetical protein M407DRAFT_219202 [Tulasnella calospora MUT 4182]